MVTDLFGQTRIVSILFWFANTLSFPILSHVPICLDKPMQYCYMSHSLHEIHQMSLNDRYVQLVWLNANVNPNAALANSPHFLSKAKPNPINNIPAEFHSVPNISLLSRIPWKITWHFSDDRHHGTIGIQPFWWVKNRLMGIMQMMTWLQLFEIYLPN